MEDFTFEQKKERVYDFRVIDDAFFEVVAKNPAVCQEILRVILEDDKLFVNDVIVQSSERNIYGKSVRLDALCTLADGTKCNIEVQRSNNDDHLKRARYNASVITLKNSTPGKKYENVQEVYIVYISEFDFLKGQKTIYHIDKVLRETGKVVDDGLHEIFVNTVIDDGTDIADLMSCFTKKEVNNPKFPALSSEVKRLKETEGGVSAVCEVMEYYNKEAVKAERIEKIQAMLKQNCSEEFILSIGYTKEDYLEAQKLLLCPV